MRLSILLVTVASAITLAFAGFARANTLCVHQAGQSCPAGATDEGANLQTALDVAGSDGQPTTIDVLAGTYPGGFLSLSAEPLVIAGAGSANTILTGPSPVLVLGCAGGCQDGTFAVHDVGLQMSSDGSAALGLSGSYDAHDVTVTSSTDVGALSGVALAGSATLEHAKVMLPQTGAPTTAISATGINHASDLNLVADVGISASAAAAVTVSRATIDASVEAVNSHGPGTNLDDVLIRLTGDGAQIAESIASGVTSSVNLLNSTVIATGGNDYGFFLQSEGSQTGNHQATVSVTNSILWGLALSGQCIRGPGGPVATLTLSYDDIDPSTAAGTCTPAPSHTLAVTPGFVSAGDMHLRRDSPLVDQGDPALSNTPGVTDLAGNARVTDGDGNGNAARDIGAYEYGRRPPVAAATAPATAAAGQVITFDASGSFDPDPGETLSYHWDFGDGASASTAIATHAFAGAGVHTATASVTDPTNQTTSAQVTVTIPGAGGGSTTPTAPTTPTTPTSPATPTTTSTTPAKPVTPTTPTTPGATTHPPGTTTAPTPAAPSGPGTSPAPHPAPKLTIAVGGAATIARLLRGLHVTATLTGAGRITLTLRQGVHKLVVKRLTFTRAGRRTVVLHLSKKRAATIRRATRVRATLTATLSGSNSTTVHKTLLLRG